jgi:hypothetical protein
MDREPRVRPSAPAGGLVLVEQRQAHDEPEHGAPERLGHARREGRVGHLSDDGPPGAVRAREVLIVDRLQAVQVVRLRHAGAAGGLHGEGNAEVGHEGVPILAQDVLGLDGAEDAPLRVGVLERVAHGTGNPPRVVERQLPLAREPVAPRLAAPRSGCRTLMVTSRSCVWSCARHTVAMPPAPSSRSTR